MRKGRQETKTTPHAYQWKTPAAQKCGSRDIRGCPSGWIVSLPHVK
jgi:hypothetical protein